MNTTPVYGDNSCTMFAGAHKNGLNAELTTVINPVTAGSNCNSEPAGLAGREYASGRGYTK